MTYGNHHFLEYSSRSGYNQINQRRKIPACSTAQVPSFRNRFEGGGSTGSFSSLLHRSKERLTTGQGTVSHHV